jgi:hypothetical protein
MVAPEYHGKPIADWKLSMASPSVVRTISTDNIRPDPGFHGGNVQVEVGS